MLNLSDITGYYIEHSYTDSQKLLLLNGFSLLETFNFNGGFYEDKYINLISRDDITNDTKQLTILMEMQSDILDVIKQHKIKINTTDISLSVLIEIAQTLLLISNLEDYSDVCYRINGTSGNRILLIDILQRYSTLSRLKLMEVIEDVDTDLIETIRELSADALNADTETISEKHRLYVQRFFEFTENAPCLGLTLLEKGYSSTLTLEDLSNILPYSIMSYVEQNEPKNQLQVYLDILSLLIITRDDYDLPILKLKRLSYIFSADLLLINRVSDFILRIMNDFGLHLEAHKQGDKLNGN